MKKSRFSGKQVVGILREEQGGMTVGAVCAKHHISRQTFYSWKHKYRGMDVSDVQQMRALTDEIVRLKRIVADSAGQIRILKAVNAVKMRDSSSKRTAVKFIEKEGLGGKAQACRALDMARSGAYRLPAPGRRIEEGGKAGTTQISSGETEEKGTPASFAERLLQPPSMPVATTTRALAKAAGVNQSTISRALARDPTIGAQTRERIRQVAANLGYRPNPLLSAFMSQRRSLRASPRQLCLAWLTDIYPSEEWRHLVSFSTQYQGAQERAAERGYRLEEFSLGAPGMSARRVTQILQTRNIRGILIGPLAAQRTVIDLPWNEFSAVVLTHTLENPNLTHVTSDHYHSMQLALRECRKRGYQRPGFVLKTCISNRIEGRWLAAATADQYEHCPGIPLDPLTVPAKTLTPAMFKRWFARLRPDVIIGMPWVPDPWLEVMKSKLTPDAWISLDILAPDGSTAGIYQNHKGIGAAGADLLISRLERNETGVHAESRRLLIDGIWVDGTSLPAR